MMAWIWKDLTMYDEVMESKREKGGKMRFLFNGGMSDYHSNSLIQKNRQVISGRICKREEKNET